MQPFSLFDLAGQVVAITGGSGVLPGAMARGLAAYGAKVALLSRTLSKAEKVAADIVAEGGEALAVATDVTDRSSLEAAAQAVLARFGRVDHLINGAGGNRPGANAMTAHDFFDIAPDELRTVIDLNLLGSILPAQVFGRLIAQLGTGSILNISSISAARPLTRVAGYSAAKAGVENFTRWLAVVLARDISRGLRVNAIVPGFFLGEQNRTLLVAPSGEVTPRGRAILDHTPMGRFGEPDDLLATTIWLLSPGARFVTGVIVAVDGGFSAYAGV
jgi:NAD(P)-dependent dehydrogenase (short-subunit alcohol dehydrogenase family)